MKTKEKTVDSYREVVGSCLYEYLKMNFFLKGEERKFQRKKIITLIKERLL